MALGQLLTAASPPQSYTVSVLGTQPRRSQSAPRTKSDASLVWGTSTNSKTSAESTPSVAGGAGDTIVRGQEEVSRDSIKPPRGQEDSPKGGKGNDDKQQRCRLRAICFDLLDHMFKPPPALAVCVTCELE